MGEFSTYLRAEWQRSTLRRVLHWFFSWRNLRKTLFLLACAATLLALVYAEENWRGRRIWKRVEADLKAQGEPVRTADVVPPEIPDAQNFAATPFFDLLFATRGRPDLGEHWDDYSGANTQLKRIRAAPGRSGPERRLVDLVAWDYAFRNTRLGETNENLELPAVTDSASRSNAARAVVEWLRVYEPVLNELASVAARPSCRYPVEYDTPNPIAIRLPHLTWIKYLAQILELRAAAYLATGETEAAARDVGLILRLADSLQDEPILISQLVRVACFNIALNVVWEGLRLGSWREEDVASFEKRLVSCDFIGELRYALGTERALCNSVFDYLRVNPREAAVIVDSSMDDDGAAFLLRWLPRGWLHMEQANYNRLFAFHVIVPEESGPPRLNPKLVEDRTQRIDNVLGVSAFTGVMKHQHLSRLLLPALDRAVARFARAQAMAEMGAMACALERHRRVHGKYPERLELLAGMTSIPVDVVSTNSYRYRLAPESGFVLYSVGWNQTDDGGTESTKPDAGDWVWRY